MAFLSLPSGKIDPVKLLIVEDEDEESITMEDLAELLPENTPRYIVLSFEVRTLAVQLADTVR